MSFPETVQLTLGNPNMVSAVSSSILIILLGFYLAKKEVFSKVTAKVLTNVVLSVAIPALAYTAFMQDINEEQLRQGTNILIWGFVMYIAFIFISKLFYVKSTGDKKDVLEVLTTFGSTTFFGLPIIGAVYGPQGIMFGSIFNIAYRVFLYSYAYIKLSNIEFSTKNLKEMFLNPIILATFLGLFVWVFQGSLPQVSVAMGEGVEKSFAFLRIDQTAKWLFVPLQHLSRLCSPLAWLAIGAKLAEIPFTSAMKSTTSWYYSLVKIVFVPVINIVALYVLTITGILPISFVSLAAVVIMMATPPATVAVAYAINSDKEAVLTSNLSLISTVACVVAMPIWIVILEVIRNLGMFA